MNVIITKLFESLLVSTDTRQLTKQLPELRLEILYNMIILNLLYIYTWLAKLKGSLNLR